MKTVDSSLLLRELELRVESCIQLATSVLQNLDVNTQTKPSVTGGWSITQCLDHLNNYGYFYLPLIKVGLDKKKFLATKKEFKSTWLGNYFIHMMQTQPSKKYSAMKQHLPAAHLDSALVIGEFIHQQELLLVYLNQAKAVDLNKIKISTSISKFLKLKLGDVFQFIIAHNERHLNQAKRNL